VLEVEDLSLVTPALSASDQRVLDTRGGVSERSKETVLKTVGPDPGLVGSNPTPSAGTVAGIGEVAEWSKALAC
jgi:hypothetical protein